MDAGYGVSSSSSTDTAVQLQETQSNEQDTVSMLKMIKDELEDSTWTKLQNALKIALQNAIATELNTCIERTIVFLYYQSAESTPRGALDALRRTTEAFVMLVQGEQSTGYAERAHATGVTFDGRREALPVGPRARVWWQNHRGGKYPFDAGYK